MTDKLIMCDGVLCPGIEAPYGQSDNLLDVSGLSFAYPNEPLLFDSFDLSIPQGEISCLVGQNGCGKTTLLRLMAGQLRSAVGEIQLLGHSIRHLKPRQIARELAMVQQRNIVPDDLTVEELVAYGRTPHQTLWNSGLRDQDHTAIDRALRLTDIEEIRNRTVAHLSGGQAQRVWIAMALAQETPCLFLDEPTSFLDIRYQLEILRLIRRLNREEGMSIVMVFHDINQALAYSDRIVALKAGRLICNLPASEFAEADILAEVYDCDLPVLQMNGNKVVQTF